MLRSFILCGFLAVAACVLGCGGGDVSAPTGEVKGVVTYQGKPVPNVHVVFTPQQGRVGMGTTDANGEFTISTFAEGDGAVPGTHKVTLADTTVTPMPGSEAEPGAKPPPPPFPAKYSDPAKSDLTVEVKEGEVNEVTLELTD